MSTTETLSLESMLEILKQHLLEWLESLVRLGPNLILAVLIVAFFLFASRFASKAAYRLLVKRIGNTAVLSLSISFIQVFILALGLFYALGALNLSKTVTSLLAGAGVVGLAVGFALQDLAANLFAGIVVAIRKPFQIGDIISVGGYIGEITQVDLRVTHLRDFEGLDVLIPNRKLVTEEVTNYTLTPERLIEINLGVAYDSDLNLVEKVTYEAISKVEGRILSRAPEVYFSEFADSSINLRARFWIIYPGDSNYFKAFHQGIKFIKAAYDANGINIPFPIRTVYMNPQEGEKS